MGWIFLWKSARQMKLLEQGGENNTIKKEERPDYFNYGEPTAEGGEEHNGAEAKSIKNVVVPGKEGFIRKHHKATPKVVVEPPYQMVWVSDVQALRPCQTHHKAGKKPLTCAFAAAHHWDNFAGFLWFLQSVCAPRDQIAKMDFVPSAYNGLHVLFYK